MEYSCQDGVCVQKCQQKTHAEICVFLNGVIAKLYQGNLRHRFPLRLYWFWVSWLLTRTLIPWSLDGLSTFFLGPPVLLPDSNLWITSARYFSFGICRAFNVTFGQVGAWTGPRNWERHWVLFGSQNSEFFSDYPLVNIQKAENCHRNSWLTHKQWWFSTVVLVYQRVPDIWIETIGSNHEKMAPVVAPFPEKLKTWRQWAAASSVVLRFCFWDDWWMQMDVPVDRWCGESPQYRFVRLVKCIFF